MYLANHVKLSYLDCLEYVQSARIFENANGPLPRNNIDASGADDGRSVA